MSADDDDVRRFVRRAMGAAVPPREAESRALAGLVLRMREPSAVVGDGAREAAAMVAAAAQELSPAGAAVVAGAAAPSLVKIVIAVVVAGAAGTIAWRSSQDTAADASPSVAVAPQAPAIVAVPAPAEPPTPTSAPIAAPPAEAAPIDDAPTAEGPVPRRSRAKPTSAPPAAVEDTLVAETELVAAADRALARGQAEEALALTADHARRFADGQLVLERRAIELSARCVLDRAGARDDAAAFLRTHADTSAAAKVRARCSSDDSDRSQ